MHKKDKRREKNKIKGIIEKSIIRISKEKLENQATKTITSITIDVTLTKYYTSFSHLKYHSDIVASLKSVNKPKHDHRYVPLYDIILY